MTDSRPALTPAQVAQRLSFDRCTVYAMLNANIIRGVKLCGRWRVPEAEMERILQQPTQKTRRDRRDSSAAMVRQGISPQLGAFAIEAHDSGPPSEYLDGPSIRQG